MAKNLKLNLKNIQLGKTTGLEKLKAKLAGDKGEEEKPKKAEEEKPKKEIKGKTAPAAPVEEEKPRRIRAKTKSAFAPKEEEEEALEASESLAPLEPEVIVEESSVSPPEPETNIESAPLPTPRKMTPKVKEEVKREETTAKEEPKVRLGPTGRHVKDLYVAKKEMEAKKPISEPKEEAPKPVKKEGFTPAEEEEERQKGKKIREFKDIKPPRREVRQFDSRDRQGLSQGEEERWRKRRTHKTRYVVEENIIRPTELKVRLPISIKELASEMKLKSSELIQKLFLQGVIVTLNDILDDETMVGVLGSEFGCTITIDRSEENRIQVTSQSVQEEISATSGEELIIRPPVVTFMGHVDHGKTSLIDAIRQTNLAAGEAGAITQHIGAFRCKTAVGDLTILDTPGHEAFSSMRARGASATDIVVLVVAGDEGIKEQTLEAIQHAKSAKVTIVVAINKCDKPGFNAENVYRQLAEIELLPESWGGQTITVNTSAQTKQGISELLEMLALQAEVLNLKANPKARARGIVIESELQKGLGMVATVLVQNGTLRGGDAIVLGDLSGRIKTMRDEFGNSLQEAGPSSPVEITGLSGLPKAGDSFVVVKNEKEARDIAAARASGIKQKALLLKKAPALESLQQLETKGAKKVLKLVLLADVQGSLEALKTSLMKIHSAKVDIDIIATGVGEISESDAQLAAASRAVILGFHTQIESHASTLIKEQGVQVKLYDIIYHAIDGVKELMLSLLDKIEEEKETGRAHVQATFKASHLGVIAGCIVTEGLINRNHFIKVMREGKQVWKGKMASLKRVKEDVKEVKKGIECGILLEHYNEAQVDDILVAYEIVYHKQEL